MSKIKKNNSAITLIALVITIVVLIILAAVAINLSLGNNGIFNRAKTAKEQYQNAEQYEKSTISTVSNSVDEYTINNTSRNDIEEHILWTGSLRDKGQYATLNDSINNYKYILVGASYYSNGGIQETLLRVEDIKNLGYSTTAEHYLFNTYDNIHFWASFGSDTTIYITNSYGTNAFLRNVVGIK